MNTDNLELRPIENKEDVASAISFLNTVLSHEITDELWEWEFNTFSNEIVITIIKNKNETIGTQFMMPIKMIVSGAEVLSGKCENSFLNDKYRGKGLFQKLFSLAEEICVKKSYGLLWAFTGAIKSYEKSLGFTAFPDIMYNFSMQVGRPGMRSAMLNNKNPFKAFLKFNYYSLKYFAFKFKCRSFAAQIKYSALTHKYLVRDTLDSYEGMDRLYGDLEVSHGHFVHVKIDKPFLEWRILKNFNLKYITRYFYENKELVGYYIFSVNDSSAHISDFTPLNGEISNFMMCHLLKEISNFKVSTLTYFGNIENEINKSNFSLLLSFGGNAYVNNSMPFVYKSIGGSDANAAFLSSSKNWYLNGMWTEGLAY